MPKDEDGNYNNANLTGPQYNPMGHIWEIDTDGYKYTSRIQGYVDVTLLKGLTFRMTQGFILEIMYLGQLMEEIVILL